jgi:hypothetical protein
MTPPTETEDTVIIINNVDSSIVKKITTHYKSQLDDLPAYVLIFMLFMASSYFTNFFPKHTANLIIENPLARHLLGYTILVTSISSIKSEETTISVLFISLISYTWCYLLSRQGPLSFSVSVLLLIVSYLLNRDIQKTRSIIPIIIRRICIGIVFLSIFLDFAKSAT